MINQAIFQVGSRVKHKDFYPAGTQTGTVVQVYPGSGTLVVVWDGDEDLGGFETDPNDVTLGRKSGPCAPQCGEPHCPHCDPT